MKAKDFPTADYATYENPVLAECPACKKKGPCAISQYFYFMVDKIALRCATCKHIWSIDPDDEIESA